MKRLIAALLVLGFWLASAPSSMSESRVFYLAHLNSNDPLETSTGAMAVAFQKDVALRSKGALRVETFPEGQLGKESHVVALVRKGVIQSAIVSIGGLTKLFPMIDILNDPFRFRYLAEVYRVYDGAFGKELAAAIEAETALKVLGYGDTAGLFVLTNSKRPIVRPEDLKGLRIRTMTLESHQVFLKAFGAVPMPISWSELYGALEKGVADGQMNPPGIVRLGRLQNVQKHLTATNHFYTPYIWVANAKFLESLPPDLISHVEAAAVAGVGASRRMARRQAQDIEFLAGQLRVNQLSDEAFGRFKAVAEPVMEKFFKKKYGDRGVRLLRAYRGG